MSTDSLLQTVNVFPSLSSYETNKGSISNDELNIIPVDQVVTTFWSDGTNWYKIWSNGWKEQGGVFGANTGGWVTVTLTFNIAFNDTSYCLYTLGNWSDAASSSCKITAKTSSNATVTHATNLYATQPAVWYACGY